MIKSDQQKYKHFTESIISGELSAYSFSGPPSAHQDSLGHQEQKVIWETVICKFLVETDKIMMIAQNI